MELAHGQTERRSRPRQPIDIHSLEDAHKLVEAIARRDVASDPRVKAWQLAKQSTWLSLLAGAFLLFFFVSVIYEVIKLAA
jgi:hypothetical protein